MQEFFPKPETPIRAQLIRALKEKGTENEEAKSLLSRWAEEEGALSERDYSPRSKFDFELKKAQLFLEAGLPDLAIYYLEGALMMASEEGEVEYWDEVNAELGRVRGML